MIIFCRSELPNKELKESFNISLLLVPDAWRKGVLCMNNRLYCLKDHTLVTHICMNAYMHICCMHENMFVCRHTCMNMYEYACMCLCM